MKHEIDEGMDKFFSYRLINVLYIMSLIVFLLCVIWAGFFLIPEKWVNNDVSYISCKNGTSYSFKDLGIDIYETKYPWQKNISSLDGVRDQLAQDACLASEYKIIHITGIGMAQVPAKMTNEEIKNFILNKYDEQLTKKWLHSANSKDKGIDNYQALFQEVGRVRVDAKDLYNSEQSMVSVKGSGEPRYSISLALHETGSWSEALILWVGGFLFVYSILNVLKETLVYLFLGKKFTWNWLKKPSNAILQKLNHIS